MKPWWQETHDIVANFHDEDPLFVLMDANAPPGAKDDHVVFREGFSSTTSTPLMRAFLQTHGLCLPATCHSCHRGEHGTWIDFRGEKWHCIDHIAVPMSWLCACTHSQVLEEFDLATTQEDHRVIALQLKWSATYAEEIKKGTKRSRNLQGLNNTRITQLLHAHRPVKWETDIEQHLEVFNADIQAALQVHAEEGEAGHGGKKLYFDEAIWEHRREKLRHRATLKALRKKCRRRCFSYASLHGKGRDPSSSRRLPTSTLSIAGVSSIGLRSEGSPKSSNMHFPLPNNNNLMPPYKHLIAALQHRTSSENCAALQARPIPKRSRRRLFLWSRMKQVKFVHIRQKRWECGSTISCRWREARESHMKNSASNGFWNWVDLPDQIFRSVSMNFPR